MQRLICAMPFLFSCPIPAFACHVSSLVSSHTTTPQSATHTARNPQTQRTSTTTHALLLRSACLPPCDAFALHDGEKPLARLRQDILRTHGRLACQRQRGSSHTHPTYPPHHALLTEPSLFLFPPHPLHAQACWTASPSSPAASSSSFPPNNTTTKQHVDQAPLRRSHQW